MKDGYAVIKTDSLSNSFSIDFGIELLIHQLEKEPPIHSEDDWRIRRWLNAEESSSATYADTLLYEKR